jgi:hypothetical protein
MPGNVVRLVFAGDAKDLDKAAASADRSLGKFKSSVDATNASISRSNGGFKKLGGTLGALPNLFNAAKDGALKGGLDLGSQVADGLGKGLLQGSKGLAGPGGAIAATVGAPVALAAAAAAGSLLGAAIIGGLGAGLAGIGLTFAAKSEVVQAEISKLGEHVNREMQRISKPFEKTILDVIPLGRQLFDVFARQFELVVPQLAQGLSSFAGFVKVAFEQLAPAIAPISDAFNTLLADLGPKLPEIFAGIANALIDLANNVRENSDLIIGIVSAMLKLIAVGLIVINWLVDLLKWLDSVGRKMMDFHVWVSNAFMGAARSVLEASQWIIDTVASLPGRILSALGNIGNLLWSAGSNLIGGFINGIVSRFNEVRSWLNSLTSMLPSWKGPMTVDAKLLVDNGQAIMESLVQGFKVGEPLVKGYLNGLTSGLAQGGSASTSAAPRAAGGAVAVTFAGNTNQAVASLIMELIRKGQIQLGRA